MEARIENVPDSRSPAAEKLVDEIRAMLERAEQKAIERAKAADRLVRDHPYQTIGLAFGLGLLIGVLARRR
jgi:ElaB/YqjD/DUF883 family membrane-anchored ribosome-binding protein